MKHKSLKFFGNLSIFIVLPLVPLLIFWFVPLAVSFWLSTTDWDYISPVIESVGIGNYQTIMSSSVFHEVLKNTFVFTLWTVVPTIILGFLAAILVQQIDKGRSLLKTLIFSPWFTPTVAISIVWSWIFQPDIGVLNQVLGWFNLPQPAWLQSSEYAMWAIIIVTVWKGIGWCMLFYCDAIERIPKDIIEVCQLEGTGPWQMIKTVYLPYTSPTSLFLIVTTIISSLQAYDQIQVMTQGGPSGSTRTLLYYYYQLAFEQFDMGMATALATIILVITGLISLLQFGLSKYWVHYQ
ncbi:carbohydrate ABC transporter permease [Marinilactibacillus sp. GCM10026970]|uniref:carbohydrate ABC transporter permease n=1 Tax=Marinilactibacillus sp. GCM10026970 TaxID=3252642 RepID=UPI00361EBEB2